MTAALPPIMLVDDFSDALEMYEEYLTFKGYRVLTAASGRAAIEVAREHRPAVILMDVEMSDMTGTEALRHLRADPTLATVPIVAFTAHAMDRERQDFLAAGFDDVVPKPCLPDVLATIVDRLVARQESQS